MSAPFTNSLTVNRQALALLQTARERLVRDGWVKGRFIDWQGRRCMVGALNLQDEADTFLANERAKLLLVEAIGYTTWGEILRSVIINHNDNRCKSLKEDVLPWIDRAITLAEQRITELSLPVESTPDSTVEAKELVLA